MKSRLYAVTEVGHEKVGLESLKPCVFCQITSLLLLNLSMTLNMRKTVKGPSSKASSL